jgi:carbon-monoxide dehydrogenase medium subunit/6-hydroxypseudooxynicotine dehydrogenase subunit alpha
VKPPPFEYDDPRSVDETLALLAEHGDAAKILAGGQSLVPLMNFRLARPERLVDINGVHELDFLRIDGGTLRIGAVTRQAVLERAPDVAGRVPLLVKAIRHVGHSQIRNRGTVGGSVAHADPAAELPAAFAALDARFRVRSARGERTLSSDALFITHLTTSLDADELLTEIEVPLPPPEAGAAFVEFARRHGDFALGGAAAVLTLAKDGTCERASVVLLAAAPTPLRRPELEEWLRGVRLDEQTAAEAADRAVADVKPTGDIHGGSDYRRRLLRAMVRRALLEAAGQAREAR